MTAFLWMKFGRLGLVVPAVVTRYCLLLSLSSQRVIFVVTGVFGFHTNNVGDVQGKLSWPVSVSSAEPVGTLPSEFSTVSSVSAGARVNSGIVSPEVHLRRAT